MKNDSRNDRLARMPEAGVINKGIFILF